jgi:Lar family restriction alleviation protein
MPEHAKNEPPWTLQSLNREGDKDLETCPFCGSRELRLYEYTYAKLFAVDCKRCGAQGPRHPSPRQARLLWNDRSPEGFDACSPEETPG